MYVYINYHPLPTQVCCSFSLIPDYAWSWRKFHIENPIFRALKVILFFSPQYWFFSSLLMVRLRSSELQVTGLINKKKTGKLTERVFTSRMKFEWLWENVLWFFKILLFPASSITTHCVKLRAIKCATKSHSSPSKAIFHT